MAGVVICHKNKNCVNDRGRYHFGISWTADENGDVPDTALPSVDGYVVHAVTKPGTPAPTAGYGILIEDPCGVDVMNGGMSSLSASVDEQFTPNVGGKKGDRMVQGQMVFKLSDNNVADAKGKCIIFIQE